MHILFDEAGKLLTGRLLSEAPNSLQVELDSGKRLKVKSAQALLRFEESAAGEFLRQATQLCQGIELPLAYEFAPEQAFDFVDLAREYFSSTPSTEQQAATLLCLQAAPHYFRRLGKGQYRKAAPEVLAQALAAIEKKKQVQAQVDAWAQELVQGQCPAPVRDQLYKILFKPDKNAPEYKAVVQAARSSQTAPLVLLQKAQAITSAYQFHWQRFLFDQFPKGPGFAALPVPALTEELPLAPVQAFSIDDSHTTEIDDALSLEGLGTGVVTLGIHIAAPALALAPDSPLDREACTRLSTVYLPGHKITMLPQDVVQAYTLEAGCHCPAVSLYVTFDEATLSMQSQRTAIERVFIAHNLRHDQLDAIVTPAWLAGSPGADSQMPAVPAPLPALQPQLAFMFRLAQHLKAQREVVRGRPETFSRPDYVFRLSNLSGPAPTGSETIDISTRERGAPLDAIVAEAMILANTTWGQWLAECGVPGIYRSQASLAPGIKVRMGTKAQPHAGIGVPSYAWSTSPLRRYVDMVNQWQIIACVRHGKMAALAAAFKPKDASLFAIVSAFDGAHAAYRAFQNSMELYWTLQYIKQNGITEVNATLIKDKLARVDTLPLVLPVAGADGLLRGARLRVRLSTPDLITLEVSGTVVECLSLPVGVNHSESAQTPDDDEEASAAPLALAIDVHEMASGDEDTDPSSAAPQPGTLPA